MSRVLTNGKAESEMPDYRDTQSNGQQKAYVILSEEERTKPFARPVRRAYVHAHCGAETVMSQAIAETYARDPKFYGATFCVRCSNHYPVAEFVWAGTEESVGT